MGCAPYVTISVLHVLLLMAMTSVLVTLQSPLCHSCGTYADPRAVPFCVPCSADANTDSWAVLFCLPCSADAGHHQLLEVTYQMPVKLAQAGRPLISVEMSVAALPTGIIFMSQPVLHDYLHIVPVNRFHHLFLHPFSGFWQCTFLRLS